MFDALNLAERCGDTRPSGAMPRVLPVSQANAGTPSVDVFVSVNGSDSWPGTPTQPFRTVARALGAVRLARAGAASATPASITLFAGKYYLDATIVLTAVDSYLSIQRFKNDYVELSGGVPLDGLQWTSVSGGALYVAKLASRTFATLFADGRRAVRARQPNGDAETSGTSAWFGNGTWLPPLATPAALEVHVAAPLRASMFSQFEYGVGGSAHVFAPPRSYWALGVPCENEPPPMACGHFRLTSGVVSNAGDLPTAPYRNASTGVVHVMQDEYWGSMMFGVARAWPASGNATALLFAAGGGGQQARSSAEGSIWFVENLIELLDAPNEWFYDEAAALLYYIANNTHPSSIAFTRTNLKQLIVVAGSQDMPVSDCVCVRVRAIPVALCA